MDYDCSYDMFMARLFTHCSRSSLYTFRDYRLLILQLFHRQDLFCAIKLLAYSCPPLLERYEQSLSAHVRTIAGIWWFGIVIFMKYYSSSIFRWTLSLITDCNPGLFALWADWTIKGFGVGLKIISEGQTMLYTRYIIGLAKITLEYVCTFFSWTEQIFLL